VFDRAGRGNSDTEMVDTAGARINPVDSPLYRLTGIDIREHHIGGTLGTAPFVEDTLHAQLDALPWQDAPRHAGTDRGHGRIERRTIQVLPAPEGIAFPYAAQAFLIERYVTDLAGNPISAVAALGITSLSDHRADPPRIAQLVRDHWGIENKLHYVRDVAFGED
ncbi:MAG: hypothetical protein M3443_17850, partial [Actinomycetota bacterium]|nr:hypothetical protein [Actinomycetota bacterium]